MITWGITALSHDASITVLKDDEILFAAHSERYSRIKNDDKLHPDLIHAALQFGDPDKMVWYENPYKKKLRHLSAGQFKHALSISDLPKRYLKRCIDFRSPKVLKAIKNLKYVDHHESHAAGGFFTSKFNTATIIVMDAIGEFDTVSVWRGEGNSLTKLASRKYPFSHGLFYTAMTQLVGLKPNEEEYILMGMAAFCNESLQQLNMDSTIHLLKKYIQKEDDPLRYSATNYQNIKNLHKGVPPEFLQEHGELTFEQKCKIAKFAQLNIEAALHELVCLFARPEDNLIFSGGCALNCVANSKILKNYAHRIWIMPNPGDAGSSLGCALASNKVRIKNFSPYLGHEIKGEYPVAEALTELLSGNIIGIAAGKAEFGPRALGNRSLLADPRGELVQDKVNVIKKRDSFRPFAPVIMEEFFHEYFEGIHPARMYETTSPYMQYTFRCKQPDKFPGICHVDGTSRVQTVNHNQHPGLYALLLAFYKETGCPMLLNTSLNIKGQPLVNRRSDARAFTETYGIKVLTGEIKWS